MKEEPKKVTVEVENWDHRGTYSKIMAQREKSTQEALKKCVHVAVKPPQDPYKKLSERIATYHNLRNMRTDYKNYVRKYGTPDFTVPSEIGGN